MSRGSKPSLLINWLALAGWAVAAFGLWLPWNSPRSAALRFNLFELSEWITRLPSVRDGSLGIGQLHFLAVLGGSAVAGGLIAGWALAGRHSLRRTVLAVSALNALLILPGYPAILFVWSQPEATAQAVLGLAALVGLAVSTSLSTERNARAAALAQSAVALATLTVVGQARSLADQEFNLLLVGLGNAGAGFSLFVFGQLLVAATGFARAVNLSRSARAVPSRLLT